MSIDYSKPIEFVDGRPARFVCKLKGEGAFRNLVVVDSGDYEYTTYVDDDGMSSRSGPCIRNKPREIVRYVNVYPWGLSVFYDNRCEAEKSAEKRRIACIRVAFKEGQFDD